MSQAKDDKPPTDNEKNELFPSKNIIPEMKPAFATFNYGQEKNFDRMGFMESHSSLSHIICSVIQSWRRSPGYDQIQKPSHICQELSQDDNVIEKDQITTKTSQEDQILNQDWHVGQVWEKDGHGGCVLAEDGQMGSVLAEDGQVGPVLAEDGQVDPVWAEDRQVDTVLAEDGQVGPLLTEDRQVTPLLAEDEQVGPLLAKYEQVGPLLAEDGQVGPLLAKDGQVGSVLTKDRETGPILGEDGQTDPVLAEDGQAGRVLDEDKPAGQVLDEDEQAGPVLAEDGQAGPVLAEDGQVGPVFTEVAQGVPVIAEDIKEHPVLAKEGQEYPVSSEEGQEDPILAKEDPVCKSITSKQQLPSKYQSIIAGRLSCKKLSPAQMIPYVILINRSIPLPTSVIQSLCFAKKILCRIQYFKLRRKKKKKLQSPSPKQLTLKAQTDQDFITFDSLKNLQWKLYKGIAKRKPKTTVIQKTSSYSLGKAPSPCPGDAGYLLPLLPKDWLIDESLKLPMPRPLSISEGQQMNFRKKSG